MNKGLVLSYLDFFVKTHPNSYDAIEKWKEDRRYIAGYKINESPKVKVEKLVIIDPV